MLWGEFTLPYFPPPSYTTSARFLREYLRRYLDCDHIRETAS
jgi:hypothetical protein